MKKMLFLACTLFIILSCGKEGSQSSSKPSEGIKGKQELKGIRQKIFADVSNVDNGGTGACFSEFQNHATDDGALQQLHECVWSNICLSCTDATPPSEEPQKSYCERWPFLCTGKREHPEGELPKLLAILGLDNSSTKTDVANAHNYLQQFNTIILGAVAANSNWASLNNVAKQTAILTYYLNVYTINNPPLLMSDVNFFTVYIDLLYYDGNPKIGEVMIVSPAWAYKLFYDGPQPAGFPEPTSGGYFDALDSTNGFLTLAGISIGFLPEWIVY
ncbi:MAG: hypothetical protein J0I41_08935 [Filimonas sp.]|nr:hypothetical protein [Filimonas sp.]